jgi:CHASE2 domain-containing sensor protein
MTTTHSKRRHWVVGVVVVFLLALGMQFLEFHGALAGPEGFVLDRFLKLALFLKYLRSAADRPQIVTVEIDDQAYKTCFDQRSPLSVEGISDLMKVVTDRFPSPAVGLDILTDSDSRDFREAYQRLRETYPEAVWLAGGKVFSVEQVYFHQWLLWNEHEELLFQPTFVLGKPIDPSEEEGSPNERMSWGPAVFPRDEDLRLRRFPREVSGVFGPGKIEEVHTWPRKIAEAYLKRTEKPGIEEEAHEVILSYDERSLFRFRVDCSNVAFALEPLAALQNVNKLLPDPIVLIGGTFGAARDFHESPNGPLPGLIINAHAVEAELRHSGIREFPRRAMFLLDLLCGMVILRIFSDLPSRSVRSRINWCILVFAVAIALSFAFFLMGRIWLSIIGISIGIDLHVLLEVWREDPQLRDD